MPVKVSIVVPTRNRFESLRACLRALLAQKPTGVAEIVVVDDGSTGDSFRYLERLARRGLIVCLRTGGAGPAAARNAGIRRARNAVIALTDDDCLVPCDWAVRLAARISATGAAAVGGRVVAPRGASIPSRVSQAITNGLVAALNRDPDAAVFLTSNNVAYRADAIRAANLFDESYSEAGGEERDLHHRLQARHERLVYAPDIVVEHRLGLDWRGFLRQQAAYGRGARRFYRHTQPRPRHLTIGKLTRTARLAWAELSARDRMAVPVAFALSQAAVAWGYLRAPRP